MHANLSKLSVDIYRGEIQTLLHAACKKIRPKKTVFVL